ncbi:MAG TPA: transglutaminaseTgpA domain-containing protein [Gemmataceae bacterium]|nr:transglutaminaseTgpA domain-containing protein [Gemmataceae bacterium]
MPLIRPFRNSLYLTLALAVAAIGLAGGDLLPEIPFVTAFCLLLLGAAYALEGRWQLSLRDANVAGLFLGALLGLWAIFQAVRPPTGLADTLPWPASALPYLAPVLMVLIPAKMFRPKHVGDYWVMHGLGLLAMALACAMASEGAFILVFAAYAAAFVWSLSTFYLYRELGEELAVTSRLAGGRWRAARPAVVWAGVAGAVAVPLFWATPRSGSQWELGIIHRGRASTGLSEGPVDLNRTGPVGVNREQAFEVYVEDAAGQPVLDLSPDQRWRVSHLQQYDAGRWGRNQFGGLQTADRATSPITPPSREPRRRLPDFGPNAYYLNFVLTSKLARTPPLADPVAWRSGEYAPAVSRFDDGGYRNWVHRHDGSMDGAFSYEGDAPRYVQAWIRPDRPGDGPVMRMQPPRTEYLARVPRGMSRVRDFTNRLVERLVAEGQLPPAVLVDIDPATMYRAMAHHEAIARALERHLAASGEFTYTLDLTRKDKSVDPVEDFLLNTKSGHCQRFATALVLMLRTQGVPCQMVLGYRGCEGRGDGWYDVREDHAHAWVEVLVPASGEGLPPVAQVATGFGGWYPSIQRGWAFGGGLAVAATPLPEDWQPVRWVTLDPTPAGEMEEGGVDSLLGQARERWAAILKSLLLAYNQESRQRAADSLEDWMTYGNGPYYLGGGALALAGLWWARRRWLHTRPAGRALPSHVKRLEAILKRAGYGWPDGQTAREFARGVAEVLRATPATSAVAAIPEQVVTAYYSERFGGRLLGVDERRELDEALGRLEGVV